MPHFIFCYPEFHYVIMLSVVMLNVIMLNVVAAKHCSIIDEGKKVFTQLKLGHQVVLQRGALPLLPVGSGPDVQAPDHRGQVPGTRRHRPQRPHRQLQKPPGSATQETHPGLVRRVHLQGLHLPR